MIDRYFLRVTKEVLEKELSVDVTQHYKPLFNIVPTQLVPVMTQTSPNGFSFFYWGIPPEMSNKKAVSQKLINVPHDRLFSTASYKNALNDKRCVVPMTGFISWKQVSKKRKVPYAIFLATGNTMLVPALWNEFETLEGDNVQTFQLLVQEADGPLSSISDAKPTLLTEEGKKLWLGNEQVNENFFNGQNTVESDAFEWHAISPAIISETENKESLLKPTPPADQLGNYTLFD